MGFGWRFVLARIDPGVLGREGSLGRVRARVAAHPPCGDWDDEPYDAAMGSPVGIIAGSGELPLLQAEGIRAAGRRVVVASLGGQSDPRLRDLCDTWFTVGVLRIGEWGRKLNRSGVTRAVLVGGVDKGALMYMPVWKRAAVMRPDWRTSWLIFKTLRNDKRSQTMLTGIADQASGAGVELMDTTEFIPEHMATPGLMTRKAPSASQRQDIDFGWPVLLEMNRLDIGQGVAVCNRDVIAVEAMEGTDRMIARAGDLAGKGQWTLVKGAGPDKDMRFDVPTVGVATIEGLKQHGAAVLALAAGRVIMVDKPKVIAAADAAGIVIVGVE